MDQETLAASSGTSIPTVRRIEGSVGAPATSVKTLAAIEATLQNAGVEFIPGGVRIALNYDAFIERGLQAEGGQK